MEQEEKIKKNKLIAEYMQYKRKDLDFEPGHRYMVDGLWKAEYRLTFDTKWEWLMPVLEKIEQQGCIVELWLSLGRGCRICKVGDAKNRLLDFSNTVESMSLIEAAFNCCVEYIEWYNASAEHTRTAQTIN